MLILDKKELKNVKLKNYSITRSIIIISFLLMCILTLSLIITVNRVEKQYQTLSLNMAKSYFDTIIELRKWNASHNGVYVPITEEVQPNPFLEDPLRDVETLEGIKLTKINPAYMTRLLGELAEADLDLQFHMTSLMPINPINNPDNWEREALKDFENNIGNKWETNETENGTNLRYMEPLIVEESCLECHAKQGYQIGDVRGAISINLPYGNFQRAMKSDIFRTVLIYLSFIIVMGIILIYFGRKSYFAENERKHLIHELERSNKELEHFAYVASHDLREPLRKVSAFGQLLNESLEEKINEDEKENLGFMIDGARRLQEMIDDLLSYSRLTTQAKPFQIIDLNEVINELKGNALHTEILMTGALIEVPQLLPKVYGDLIQIRQLLQNLVANGIKYQKKDVKPVITIRYIVQDSKYLKIEVEDNGIGIDEKYFEIIFIMFKRLHGRGQYEGTGLGLAICKKVVERHGGTIGMNSVVGKGSIFWFTIPLLSEK